MVDKRILITANHNKDKRDRTQWYTIDYDVFKVYVDNIKASRQNDECNKIELGE
ncbi:MAG: hypothetical protein PHC44_09305 [Lutispora sp.]|nr:hypothetical protein [Lutispora sp.]